MAIEIVGVGGTEAARVRSWCEAAFDALGEPADLRVEVSGRASLQEILGLIEPSRVDASAGDLGIWLHRRLLCGPNQRLGFIVYEEVAHTVLARAGVPNDNLDTEEAFWQELFAGYVQVDAVRSGRIPGSGEFTTQPVPPASPLGDLGKQIGAALAGSEPNREHVEAWRSRGGTSAYKRQLVDRGLSLTPPITAAMVLSAFRSA